MSGRLLRAVTVVVEAALLVAVLALVVRFGLQWGTRLPLQGQPAVVALKRAVDPVLGATSSRAGLGAVRILSWPSAPARSGLPLALAVVVWLARAAVGGIGRRVALRLEAAPSPKKVRPAPPAAAPAQVSTQPAPPGPPPVAAPAPPSGNRIGRYEVVGELGRGAMGVVYKGVDPHIGRTVAIKTILAANLTGESLEKYKQRFMVEARSAGRLAHPGIVAVHDVAEDAAGQPCLVIEYVEGTPLDKWMSGERPPVDVVVRLLVEIAEGLDHAHHHGIVHRDVKPANVLVTKDGHAKVSDFGVAKMDGVSLTTTGQLVGTPAFMSPEQFTGSPVDARSDIFSLGAMAYLLLTGERAFPAETVTALSFKVVHSDPVPPSHLNPSLPAALDAVVLRCLAKKPEQRYASCAELARELAALAEPVRRAAS